MPTKIEWARNADGSQGETWNPLRVKAIDGKPNVSSSGHFGTGCTMVSPGCMHCYASHMNRRFYGNSYSYHSKPTEFFLDQKILEMPLRRKKPTTWFVCSMCDLFHEDVPDDMIAKIYGVMWKCKHHTFQVLTKRPKRMEKLLRMIVDIDGLHWCTCSPLSGMYLPNVWLGVSAENQEMANLRIPVLLTLPAVVRWVSFEPLLGPIDLLQCERIDWAVVGGESGPKARPMHPDWVRSLRDQCLQSGVPFFFKQWGEHLPEDQLCLPANRGEREEQLIDQFGRVPLWLGGDVHGLGHKGCFGNYYKVGKKAAGRTLDSIIYSQMPEVQG